MDVKSDDEFFAACSDDERYGLTPSNKASKLKQWEPEAADIAEMYRRLTERGYLDLEWHCPGRRSPSPKPLEAKPEVKAEEEEPAAPKAPTAFDFDDPFGADPSLSTTPAARRTTPGSSKFRTSNPSAQKRVVTFDNVMSNMMRHRKMDTEIEDANEDIKPVVVTSADGQSEPKPAGDSGGESAVLCPETGKILSVVPVVKSDVKL